MKTILHAVHVHAAPSEVYRNLTTAPGLAGWWTTDVSLSEGEGEVIEFTFMEGFNPRMRQMRLRPSEEVCWKCVAGHDNWQDNDFVFRLEARDGETMLMFTQEYARELSDEDYGIYNFNWGYYLGSLKLLCESGEGKPYRPKTDQQQP